LSTKKKPEALRKQAGFFFVKHPKRIKPNGVRLNPSLKVKKGCNLQIIMSLQYEAWQ
jgi:hypothetical protein